MRNYKKKILVVDDEEISRSIMKEQFEKLGCHVDVAATGEEAIRSVQNHPYHLIVLDINMFDMDGFNVAKRLQEMEEHIKSTPLVAVTVHALNSLKRRAKQLGFKDFVVKPITSATCEKLLSSLD